VRCLIAGPNPAVVAAGKTPAVFEKQVPTYEVEQCKETVAAAPPAVRRVERVIQAQSVSRETMWRLQPDIR
jgi:hypothetical protein